jgi:hypothetical protein
VERNVMRYYLAVQAFLETQSVPEPERFERRLGRWFELTGRYPQLHEVDWEEYLETKRRERLDLLRQQEAAEGARVTAMPPSVDPAKPPRGGRLQ